MVQKVAKTNAVALSRAAQYIRTPGPLHNVQFLRNFGSQISNLRDLLPTGVAWVHLLLVLVMVSSETRKTAGEQDVLYIPVRHPVEHDSASRYLKFRNNKTVKSYL
jgi:hypothetical protein